MSDIVDIDQFIQKVRCCRELSIPRRGNLYTHHVFVGKKDEKECDLYHYSSVSSCLGSPGQITKVYLDYEEYRRNPSSPVREIFNLKERNGDTIYIVERRDYPKDKQTEYECIQRAEKRLVNKATLHVAITAKVMSTGFFRVTIRLNKLKMILKRMY